MQAQMTQSLNQGKIGQVAESICSSGKISRADQESLRRAMLYATVIGPDDVRHIQKVFDRLQMGLLKIVD